MTNFIADLVFLQKGGFVMYFLLLLSLLVVAIGVERLLYYHRQDAGRAFARDLPPAWRTAAMTVRST